MNTLFEIGTLPKNALLQDIPCFRYLIRQDFLPFKNIIISMLYVLFKRVLKSISLTVRVLIRSNSLKFRNNVRLKLH